MNKPSQTNKPVARPNASVRSTKRPKDGMVGIPRFCNTAYTYFSMYKAKKLIKPSYVKQNNIYTYSISISNYIYNNSPVRFAEKKKSKHYFD